MYHTCVCREEPVQREVIAEGRFLVNLGNVCIDKQRYHRHTDSIIILSVSPYLIIQCYFSIFRVCYLGNRLLKSNLFDNNMDYCVHNTTILVDGNETIVAPLWDNFCYMEGNQSICDKFWNDNSVSRRPAITGLNMTTFLREYLLL